MPTKKVDFSSDWKIREELLKIVEKNCEVIPYEGTEINKRGIIEGFLEFLRDNHYSLLMHTRNYRK